MDGELSDMVTNQNNFSSVMHCFCLDIRAEGCFTQTQLASRFRKTISQASILVRHCPMTHPYFKPCTYIESPEWVGSWDLPLGKTEFYALGTIKIIY